MWQSVTLGSPAAQSAVGAPQGGLSCPFGAIHLQVARRSRVGGGEYSPGAKAPLSHIAMLLHSNMTAPPRLRAGEPWVRFFCFT